MKSYEIQTQITASADRIWQVLTQTLPVDPTPFGILDLKGDIAAGAHLKLVSEVAPKRSFALTVTTFDAPHKMVWRGGMPLGLFTGTRTFLLTPQDGGGTLFDMRECFDGLLSGMIFRSMPDLTPSFEKFAQTLKSKAETI